jgi:hypothetical protein
MSSVSAPGDDGNIFTVKTSRYGGVISR